MEKTHISNFGSFSWLVSEFADGAGFVEYDDAPVWCEDPRGFSEGELETAVYASVLKKDSAMYRVEQARRAVHAWYEDGVYGPVSARPDSDSAPYVRAVKSFAAWCDWFPATTAEQWRVSTDWERWAVLYDAADGEQRPVVAAALQWYRRARYPGLSAARLADYVPALAAALGVAA